VDILLSISVVKAVLYPNCCTEGIEDNVVILVRGGLPAKGALARYNKCHIRMCVDKILDQPRPE
jgi:hypothetical protein